MKATARTPIFLTVESGKTYINRRRQPHNPREKYGIALKKICVRYIQAVSKQTDHKTMIEKHGTQLISAADAGKAYLENRKTRLRSIGAKSQKVDYSTSIGVSVILGLAAGFITYVLAKCLGFIDPSPLALVVTAISSSIVAHHEGKSKNL
jgi:hypothetical protein